MLGEICCDNRFLMPFSSQAAVFSTVQQEIISFLLATRLVDYIRAYHTNVPIPAKRGRLGTTAAKQESQHDVICLDISMY